MTHHDDVWHAYVKGVKKFQRAKPAEKTASFRPRVGARGRLQPEPIARDSEHETPVLFSTEASPFLSPQTRLKMDSAGACPRAGGDGNDGALKFGNSLLDRRAERGLRQGDITIEARLDLHGMTQETAFSALAHFMARQVKAGKKRLLIITGKGRGNEGVLRTNLPRWLETLPEAAYILALRTAAPQHGDTGAFYVLLKKKKG